MIGGQVDPRSTGPGDRRPDRMVWPFAPLKKKRFAASIDRYLIDGIVNLTARWTYSAGQFAATACRPASCGNT